MLSPDTVKEYSSIAIWKAIPDDEEREHPWSSVHLVLSTRRSCLKNAGKNLRYGNEHRYAMDVCKYALLLEAKRILCATSWSFGTWNIFSFETRVF